MKWKIYFKHIKSYNKQKIKLKDHLTFLKANYQSKIVRFKKKQKNNCSKKWNFVINNMKY